MSVYVAQDAVVVVQSGQSSVPVPFFSGGKQATMSLLNPTASVSSLFALAFSQRWHPSLLPQHVSVTSQSLLPQSFMQESHPTPSVVLSPCAFVLTRSPFDPPLFSPSLSPFSSPSALLSLSPFPAFSPPLLSTSSGPSISVRPDTSRRRGSAWGVDAVGEAVQ
jgi:hypothetical protein